MEVKAVAEVSRVIESRPRILGLNSIGSEPVTKPVAIGFATGFAIGS